MTRYGSKRRRRETRPAASRPWCRAMRMEALEGRYMLTGIVNGDFAVTDLQANEFGWSVEGDVEIVNEQAVLDENATVFSRISQAFTITESDTGLSFTIDDLSLAADGVIPDAFEAKLLDAGTGESLIGTATGIGDTDSFLNIQASGEAFFGSGTSVSGVASSGDVADLGTSLTVVVDLTVVPNDAQAVLHFALLGFEPHDGAASIDDVFLTGTPWTNPRNRLDVNDDGFVSPVDVLININHLNNEGSGPLPVPPVAPDLPPPYHDVNGDNSISPVDVLLVINFLNSNAGGEGEAAVQVPAKQWAGTAPAPSILTAYYFSSTLSVADSDQDEDTPDHRHQLFSLAQEWWR